MPFVPIRCNTDRFLSSASLSFSSLLDLPIQSFHCLRVCALSLFEPLASGAHTMPLEITQCCVVQSVSGSPPRLQRGTG